MPTVAVIGNDAVLAASPATPVQLAHACLRHGFSVAIPASWGDELVAAEAVRRLAAREKGPAVMCVCPYVRSRLLAPGPDLAPFLVSLLPPPVAVARYLRGVYGDRGVHITYIGGCPGADDPAIDAHLTPDAFFADIAERGIALSEQPLVFDSIVPPDRRRWCSLPGGVPSPDILWNESDTRTLVEIDRDDASTDLAQHIITHDHVLLDLAPSLGCACSGAIASLPPRSARVAVTTLEPPRAPAPVIDPAAVVPLDVPVGATFTIRPAPPPRGPNADLAASEPPSALISSSSALAVVTEAPPAPAIAPDLSARLEITETTVELVAQPVELPVAASAEPSGEAARAGTSQPTAPGYEQPVSEGGPPPPDSRAGELPVEVAASTGGAEPPLGTAARLEAVTPPAPQPAMGPLARAVPLWRRTPQPTPTRHVAANVPRTVSGDGRLLPRAYVAKRRTPAGGTAAVVPAGRPATPPNAAPVPASNGSVPARPTPEPEARSIQAVPGPTPPPVQPPTAPTANESDARAASRGGARGVIVAVVIAVLLGVFVLLMLQR